ncbi:MAG: hypothetical protein ACYC09_01605 [Bacteroidota bacterium]
MALRAKVAEKNPALFEAMSQDYVVKIKDLRSEIDEYVGIGALEEALAPLWLKVNGEKIGLWSSPAGVWEETISRIRKSVLSMSKHIIEKALPDIREELRLALSSGDLRIVGARQGSLKIGLDFEMPLQSELFEHEYPDFVRLGLERILQVTNWFASNGTLEELNRIIPDQEERYYAISKAAMLIPSRRSKINFIELSGAIIPSSRPIRLVSQLRSKIKDAIPSEHGYINAEEEGVIREIDLDRGHCILRQRSNSAEDLSCKYNLVILPQVKDGLDKRVRITGTVKRGTVSPLYIQIVEIIDEQ